MRLFAFIAILCAAPLAAQAQWEVQRSGTDADLHAISAVSDTAAWASGDKGTVLRTVDGGATWQHCTVPPDAQALDLRGIQGFDVTTAVVMSTGKGELSRVYKTTDGCKSWEMVLQNPDPDGTWDSLQFQFRPGKGAEKGYFAYGVLIGHPVGGEFVIYTSKDYGNTWRTLRDDEAFAPGPAALAKPGEIPFAYSNSALSPLADGNSFAFVTGGEGGGRLFYPSGETYDFSYTAMKYTFSQVQLPLQTGASAGAFSVAGRRASADRVDLMVVGGDASKPDVGSAVFVRHGGPALKKLLAPRAVAAVQPPSGFRSAVAYNAASDSWITVGPNGTDVSHDDGRTWTRLSPTGGEAEDADKHWQAMALPFVVGPAGRIGKLHERGGTPAVTGR